jgi:uncharacterized membrane protein YkoI
MKIGRRSIAIAAAATLALAAGGVGIAVAVDGDDSDETLHGADADRAGAAALARVDGGRVLAVEREDDGRRGYEVEVRAPDGATLEVHVDDRFAVVGTEPDEDGNDEGDDD